MIDKAIGIGAGFDWMTPLASLIQGWRGKSVGVTILAGDYVPARIALEQVGIKQHRVFFSGNKCCFDVSADDASRAEAILSQHGFIRGES